MKNSQARDPLKSPKNGDLFSLGQHYLYCGDSTSAKIFTHAFSSWKMKMILTDPPYGVDYVNSKAELLETQKHRSIINDQIQTDRQYKNFTKKWLKIIKNNLDEKNSFYIFNCDRKIFSLKEALNESDFKLSQLLI
jgi:16S rRNA G966 N2-methylase RsmD